MSYAETLLAPGEVVVHRSRQHVLSLILDSRLAVVLWATAIVAIVVTFFFTLEGTLGQTVFWLEVVAIVLGVIVVAWRWWNWRNTEYLITNRRLMNVSGVLNKRSADSSLEKINDAILEENMVGRLLGYGDLDILTAADVAIDKYRMLRAAKEFKKQMLQAKHALESGIAYGANSTSRPGDPSPTGAAGNGAPLSPAVPAGTALANAEPAAAGATVPPVPLADPIDTAEEVTAALGRLADLRDRGAISSGEYEVKKRELLNRL